MYEKLIDALALGIYSTYVVYGGNAQVMLKLLDKAVVSANASHVRHVTVVPFS